MWDEVSLCLSLKIATRTGESIAHVILTQDMNKERFVQSYIEQQRAYLSAYGPIDDQCPALQGTPVQKTDNRFGFDTPVLRPRKPCSPQKSDGGDTFDKHAACHTDSNKENEPTRKKLPGRAKRKKTPSDVERLARKPRVHKNFYEPDRAPTLEIDRTHRASRTEKTET